MCKEISHNDDLRRLRVEYWTKRLDHTLTHTQTASRLIYLVDGAVLALIYFTVQTMGVLSMALLVSAFPTLLLAVLNLLHARLVRLQHSWYSGIDAKLMELLEVTPIDKEQRFRVLSSTHGVYRALHWVIAIALFLAAAGMVMYGFLLRHIAPGS